MRIPIKGEIYLFTLHLSGLCWVVTALYTKRFFRNEVNIKHKLNHCYNEKIIKLVSQAKLPV